MPKIVLPGPGPTANDVAKPLVLASGSPRRRELLGRVGVSFDVHPADIAEERQPGEAPVPYALRMARETGTMLRRLEQASRRYGDEAGVAKLRLLRAAGRRRLATAAQVARFHEVLCFLWAYPDDRAVRSAVEELLDRFDRRADLRHHSEALADSATVPPTGDPGLARETTGGVVSGAGGTGSPPGTVPTPEMSSHFPPWLDRILIVPVLSGKMEESFCR